jgi:hypothetical protein
VQGTGHPGKVTGPVRGWGSRPLSSAFIVDKPDKRAGSASKTEGTGNSIRRKPDVYCHFTKHLHWCIIDHGR